MKPVEWLLLFEDGGDPEADFSLLDEPCPVCGIEAAIWCDVLVGQAGTKIGIVHAKRVGQ